MSDLKQLLIENSPFREIDHQFAKFCEQLNGASSEILQLLVLVLSYTTGQNHTALAVDSDQSLTVLLGLDEDEFPEWETITLPQFSVEDFPAVMGRPGEAKPLIYDETHRLLYLHRYWSYERQLAQFIQHSLINPPTIDFEALQPVMAKLFARHPKAPEASFTPIDWQETAAVVGLKNRFAVISGGPGTGKTTTVAKILALLLCQDPELKIDLVAPTGKAADRLVQSIRKAKEQLPLAELGIDPSAIPEEAGTIHRYLGVLPGSRKFRYHAENKKATQLLLVDEASMVSLPMFAKLFAALQPDCRVILLGDKDQLASVENGNVLGDITAAEKINAFTHAFKADFWHLANNSAKPELLPVTEHPTPYEDLVVQLAHSFRFDAQSGIGVLAEKVNNQSISAISELHQLVEEFPDLSLAKLPKSPEKLKNELKVYLKTAGIASGFAEYKQAVKAGDPALALEAFNRLRILCAVNDGPNGVNAINELITEILFPGKNELFFAGRPVIIKTNDHNLKLYNGDIGILIPDEMGELKAWFPDGETIVDGEAQLQVKAVSPVYLPEHDTAFAITIHKSQGSEFDRVLMILPERDSHLLTKEIVYTGITRAKKICDIWANEAILLESIQRKSQRTSGLKYQLASLEH